MKIVRPTSTPMQQAPASVAVRTIGLASTDSGRNGSGAVASRQANPAQSSAEPANNPSTCQLSHGKRTPPQVSASISATAADTINAAPGRSSACLR